LATNRNVGDLNIYARPQVDAALVGLLPSEESLTANGRDESGAWYRLELLGVLGWVSSEVTALDCEPQSLVVASPDDVSALYESAFQQITLQTGTASSTEAVNGLLLSAPIDEQARLLVNNVQITLSGSAFLSAVQIP